MPAHYSVIRYVPDPIADERINVGVVVVGGGRTYIRFVRRWDRVREFAEGEVKFLKSFASDLQERQLFLGQQQRAWTMDELHRYADQWQHSIQFSEPRASLKAAEELVEEVALRFLVDAAIMTAAYQSRTDAVKVAARLVRTALRDRVGRVQARELLKLRHPLAGAHGVHHFDVVAANGRPLFAAQALSLQTPDARNVERDINAAGWSLQDVKARQADFPAAILALMPPDDVIDAGQQENRQRVIAVAQAVNVPLHQTVGAFEAWAVEQVLHQIR